VRSQQPVPQPPLGIMPRRIWLEKRFQELLAVIKRYQDAGLKPETEWLEEALDLYVELTK
jgi:hypothetical protein